MKVIEFEDGEYPRLVVEEKILFFKRTREFVAHSKVAANIYYWLELPDAKLVTGRLDAELYELLLAQRFLAKINKNKLEIV